MIFTVDNSAVIPLLDQNVFVNGSLHSGLWCTTIKRGSGAGGTQAEFQLASYLWDSWRGHLTDALVQVYVLNSFDGSAPVDPDFVGYIDVESASLSASDDTVSVTAHTITAFLSKVWVGQSDHVPVKAYKLVDPVTGLKTNNTPDRILRDLFAKLPSYYRARIGVGNVDAIKIASDAAGVDLTFRNATYAAVLEQITGLCGDVAIRERFSGTKCLLDFYRIQDPDAPRTGVRVANYDDIITSQANVASISCNSTSQECVTRVVAYGQPRQFVVSVVSNGLPGYVLVNDWSVTQQSAVLADPKRTKPGAPGHQPGMERCFRRYALPPCFNAMKLLKEIPWKRSNGQAFTAQAWYYPTLLSDDVGTGDKIGTLQATPVLIKNAKWELDKGYVEFGEPVLNVTRITFNPTSKKPIYTHAEAVVGITFAYEDPAHFLYHDTDIDHGSDVRVDLAPDGLTETFQRDDCLWAAVTNVGHLLNGAFFTCLLFNEDDPTAAPTTYVTSTLIRDDTAKLRQMARQIQREKSRKHRSYSIDIPWFTRAYAVGNGVTICGQADYIPDSYMITDLTWNLTENSTSITVDNVKPPHRREVSTGYAPVRNVGGFSARVNGFSGKSSSWSAQR